MVAQMSAFDPLRTLGLGKQGRHICHLEIKAIDDAVTARMAESLYRWCKKGAVAYQSSRPFFLSTPTTCHFGAPHDLL